MTRLDEHSIIRFTPEVRDPLDSAVVPSFGLAELDADPLADLELRLAAKPDDAARALDVLDLDSRADGYFFVGGHYVGEPAHRLYEGIESEGMGVGLWLRELDARTGQRARGYASASAAPSCSKFEPCLEVAENHDVQTSRDLYSSRI